MESEQRAAAGGRSGHFSVDELIAWFQQHLVEAIMHRLSRLPGHKSPFHLLTISQHLSAARNYL
jgi:hypothetical protein